MTIKITNQTPAEVFRPINILPIIPIDIGADEYVEKQKAYLKENMVDPLFKALNKTNPITMQDVTDPTNPIDFDETAVTEGIWHIWTSDQIDPDLDNQLTDIYYQSLLHAQQNDWLIEQQQGQEAITKLRQPLPSTGQSGRLVKYTPKTDVIPFAKKLLANPTDDLSKTEWFAYLTGFVHDMHFDDFALVTVQNHHVWDQIKELVDQLRQSLNQKGLIDKGTNKLLDDFDKVALDGALSSGMFLPEKNNELPHSFTRILMNALAVYEKSNGDELYTQPLNTHQMIRPTNLVVLNLEEYAHASDKAIIKDWDDLKKAFEVQKRLQMVSTKKLMTVKAVTAATAPSTHFTRKKGPVERRAQVPFSNKPITSKQTLHLMKKIIERTKTQRATDNTYKKSKSSYMRANRRRPDDINAMGKIVTTHFRPDIHIYIDTSGSISESQYRDAVGGLIQLTKQIDANLYISSFSHVISQTTKLVTKNKSPKQIYKSFLTIPKVTGGTDFENVWKKIDQLDILNEKTGKSYQLNFIITDFGYGLRRDRKFHRDQPSHKNTYYVPISIEAQYWSSIKNMAKNFSGQMAKAGASGIRKHMLM